jgi:hypothetical protein
MSQSLFDESEHYDDRQAWIEAIGGFRAMKAGPLADKLLRLLYDPAWEPETRVDAIDLVRRCMLKGRG